MKKILPFRKGRCLERSRKTEGLYLNSRDEGQPLHPVPYGTGDFNKVRIFNRPLKTPPNNTFPAFQSHFTKKNSPI